MAGKFWKKAFAPIQNSDGDYYEDEMDVEGYDYNEEEEYSEPQYTETNIPKTRSKVISMTDSRRNYDTSDQMNMIIFRPTEYEQAQTIIDHLKLRKPIIVNLDEIEVAVAQRILDFITGAVYALAGDIKKAARNIFVVVPSNIEISSGEETEATQDYHTDEDDIF